jgi:2-polyprenyl-3-methyl-5-hydroxy-6-metoxy-1,4-benzoquinol methylase
MMTVDDHELLAHYVARGHEAWNVSLEAAWLDFVLRREVSPLLAGRQTVCNVGIGVGLWDDWLGHATASVITSVDRDAEICRLFALRQARERHPYPARVLCGDVLEGVLSGEQFDLITCVGSTLGESADVRGMVHAMATALAPDGCLVLATVDPDETGQPLVTLTRTTKNGRDVKSIASPFA